MAFPFLSEENFETGSYSHFDSEVDTESRLDFPHYAALAKIPGVPMPFRGAYCMRVALANDGSPADAYLQETGSWDTAADGTIYFRFCFYLSSDTVMANGDEFSIFQLWSSTNTVEGGAYINYTTANGFRLGIGETSASSFLSLQTNKWHQLELFFTVDDGGSNDGSIDAWLNGTSFTQVASLDQGAITSGVIGVLSQDTGTTDGFVYFDQIVADDARIYPISDRWSEEVVLTQSSHLSLGPSTVDNVTLISGAGTDCIVSVYDTDIGATNDYSNRKIHLENTASGELVDPAGTPAKCTRGVYVSMSGTNPHAIVKLGCTTGWGSEGSIRTYGKKRKAHPLGA